MIAIALIAVGAFAVSVVAVTIFSLGSAIGYRRGVADQHRTLQRVRSPHVVVREDALSASGRN